MIGLLVANQLSNKGLEKILVEKNTVLGEEVSARNSGVIHAGFYYPAGSLKYQFCNIGNKALYSYCKQKGVNTKRTGKILVSKDKNANAIFQRYIKNSQFIGASSLTILDYNELNKLEPEIEADYGLYSPETGIVDVHGYLSALASDFEANNGLISLRTKLLDSKKVGEYFYSKLQSGQEKFNVKSKYIVFCTGLHSFNMTRTELFSEVKEVKNINFTKGHYFKLSGRTPFNHLIYPLPTKFGLGVHATFDLDGSVRFGPDTEFSSGIDYSFSPGVKDQFLSAIKDYWPDVLSENLHEDYVGVRPKIQKKNEQFADFSILTDQNHGIENCVFLQGIESPGLTCSIPIGKYVCSQLIKT